MDAAPVFHVFFVWIISADMIIILSSLRCRLEFLRAGMFWDPSAGRVRHIIINYIIKKFKLKNISIFYNMKVINYNSPLWFWNCVTVYFSAFCSTKTNILYIFFFSRHFSVFGGGFTLIKCFLFSVFIKSFATVQSSEQLYFCFSKSIQLLRYILGMYFSIYNSE